MKKNRMLSRNGSGPLLVILFLFIAGIFSFSCNNKKDEESKDKNAKSDTANVADKAGEAKVPFAAGPFAVLLLKKQTLLDLFDKTTPAKNSVKLMIQFYDENVAGSQIKAVAYGAKQNGETTLGPKGFDYAFPGKAGWDTTGEKILGDIELSQKQIEHVIGGKIAQYAADLFFYPVKDTDKSNHITYFISKMTVMKDNIRILEYPTDPDGEYANPSPPKPPCTTCLTAASPKKKGN